MKLKKILAGFMLACFLINSSNHVEAKGRLKRALAGTFLGGIAGGAVGFGIGVLSVIGIGACCPCCILIPIIGSSVLGVGAGATSGGVVGVLTAKNDTATTKTIKKQKVKKIKKKKKHRSSRFKRGKKNKESSLEENSFEQV